MPQQDATEATMAANVYPKGVINPLAIVRRAGPLVPLSDLVAKRKKPERVNPVDTSPRKALSYPSNGIGMGYHGVAKMSSIYPYVVG